MDRELLAKMKQGRIGRLLLDLMKKAGIAEEQFETTTVVQLGLRLDSGPGCQVGGIVQGKDLEVYARCGGCQACYTLQAWFYLNPTGYWERDGQRTREGHQPTFEGRTCRKCGKEIRVPAPAGARASVPLYQQF